MNLLEALARPFLVGDGANGTSIAAHGFTRQPYDLANLEAPEIVRLVHREYLDAGADFIETNTFSAGRVRLGGLRVDVAELNFAGAALARQAAGSRALVLGAIGPIGKPMAPIGSVTPEEVAASVAEQAEALAEGGVDGFLLETYIDLDELRIAVEAIQRVSSLPIIASKAFIEDGEMLAEGYPSRCAAAMAAMGVAAIGANCIVGPQRMLDLVRMMGEGTDLPILAMPTPGLPQLVKGKIAYDTSPDYFAKAAARLVEEGAKVVGGCCGTGPEHIRQLKAALGQGVRPRVRSGPSSGVTAKSELPSSEPSEMARKIGRTFVIAVEMDLPRGLGIDKLIAGAKTLKIAGTDVINISDGARARLRMTPMAACALLMSRVGVDTTMHFACRDRNLLAVQADLLGSHSLGIRNILAVTGDPANIGDYPSATSVFDIDSIGLIRILSRMNQGIDLAGYSVGAKCAFTICCAYNPMALDPNDELDRLKRKADAGAHLIYTQPVFDIAGAERALDATRKVSLPALIGVMPLRSQRHTEFMHNEVPGISIPDDLRAKMASAPDDESAAKVGLEEATRLTQWIAKNAAGLYLMPPAGSVGVAESLVRAAR